jgi:hypothetical protein
MGPFLEVELWFEGEQGTNTSFLRTIGRKGVLDSGGENMTRKEQEK